MSAAVTPRRPARERRPARPNGLARLIGVEALTVAVFATLHLTGALRVGPGSGPSYGAGVAEALICLALAGGALALARPGAGARGRRIALSAVGFAVFGFLVGLSFTLGSGDTIDLVYHLAMLPVLVATAVLLARHSTARGVPNPQKSA